MLQLLQPSWLFALAGISIPVIIHLWNQRPGRILKVGSIALVPEEAKEYKKSLKLSDLLLLLLRCLLIGAIAVVLSKPIWNKPPDSANQKGWILIPTENLQETYNHYKDLIDSLRNAGLEFHYFDQGFPKEKLEAALSKHPDTLSAKPASYWKLAESLDATKPGSIPAYIFTDNAIKHFRGNRPVLSFQPHWFSYAGKDTVVKTNSDTGKDTTGWHISIFTDQYSNDTRYVKSAIDAIQSYSKRKITLSIISDAKLLPANQDWIFWLSDQSADKKLVAENIFYYTPGKQRAIASSINFSEDFQNPSLRLYKSVINDSMSKNALSDWTDGFGRPVLSHVQTENGRHYTFYSHFDPAWNELVWDDNFPAIMYKLLAMQKPGIPVYDGVIDQQQLMPAYHLLDNKSKSSFVKIDLSGFFWMLVFVLFFAERFFSFYNNKLKTNG